jgi:ribonuclease HI
MKCPDCGQKLMFREVDTTTGAVTLSCPERHVLGGIVPQSHLPWFSVLADQAREMKRLLPGIVSMPAAGLGMAQRIDALVADVAHLFLHQELVEVEPQTLTPKEPPVTIYTDGSCHPNPGPAGYGVVILDSKGEHLYDCSVPLVKCTNNEAEYAGVINGMKMALERGERHAVLKSDSQLVIKQITGEFKCKEKKLQPLLDEAQRAVQEFEEIKFVHIRGKDNPAHEPAEAAYREAKAEQEPEVAESDE